MNAILANTSRELRAYFFSPLAYAVLTFMLFVNGYVFWLIVSYLNNPAAGAGAPLELFFGQTIFFWLVLLFITPILTMRLLAEERRSGTIEVLMTAPVTEGQVVCGKFLAAFLFYAFLWAPSLLYVGIVAYHSEVDWGPIASGYIGILGIGAVFLAIGVLGSSFTKNQIIAAISTFAILVVLFTFGLLSDLVLSPALKEIYSYLNLWEHMGDFARGIVDTRRLIYYLTASSLALFLAARVLEAKKWR